MYPPDYLFLHPVSHVTAVFFIIVQRDTIFISSMYDTQQSKVLYDSYFRII